MAGAQFYPTFIEVDSLVPLHTPDRRVLEYSMDLQAGSLIADDQAVSSEKKTGLVFRGSGDPG